MKVLLINSVCGIRSTGRICADIGDTMSWEGHTVKIAYGRGTVPENLLKYAIPIGSFFGNRLHGLRTRIMDGHGFGSKRDTKRFLKWADAYNPDLLWLHNLHGYYINVEMLFEWIKARPHMQVKWTLHDCWAFTGHCTYFSMVGCEKWKTGCDGCVQKTCYPSSLFFEKSKKNYARKKAAFTGVANMTLITPSTWLSDLVKASFLKDYPLEIQHNTIDTSVFKPTPSDFRKQYGLGNKKIILGVASVWEKRKGLDDFIRLSRMLDETYVIVLVGLKKKQIRKIPDNILALSEIDTKKALAEIYTAADIFVNPSKEETFGMTTIEALSCGTAVIVYQSTACEEIARLWGGTVVEQDPDAIKAAIEKHFSDEKRRNLK